MQLTRACLPCLVRMATDMARVVTADDTLQTRIIRDALALLAETSYDVPAPVIAARMQARAMALVDVDDPYLEHKQQHTEAALALLPEIQRKVEAHPDPFEASVKMAIAGNVIDLGARSSVDEADIIQAVDSTLAEPLVGGALEELRALAEAAQRIVVLMDNAGEIVFDIPLLHALGLHKITAVVRGGPALNDATMDDAVASGLTELVTVVPSGAAIPGTVLSEVSDEVRELIRHAQLVVAKGQGNFETFEPWPVAEREGWTAPAVVNLFKVKCAPVAHLLESLHAPLGAPMLLVR